MRTTHRVAVGIAVLITVSCAQSIRIRTDYDRTGTVANYVTFFMLDGNSSGNPVMDQRSRLRGYP